jgi:hypothetical protein
MKISHLVTVICFTAIIVVFTSCRKEISLPDESLSKLFGSWEMVQITGGMADTLANPATLGFTQSVDFSSKGIYKVYQNGKLYDKLIYQISQGKSIFHKGNAYFITYDNPGFGNTSEDYIKESIRFGGEDTLFLNEECWDCYNYVYVRK